LKKSGRDGNGKVAPLKRKISCGSILPIMGWVSDRDELLPNIKYTAKVGQDNVYIGVVTIFRLANASGLFNGYMLVTRSNGNKRTVLLVSLKFLGKC